MQFIPALLISCSAAAVAATAVAGTVTVSLVNPVAFSDAGTTRNDKDLNLKALTEHLQALGKRYLPADQRLSVEMLDVNLAGSVRLSRRHGQEFRVLKNGADWPRIALRYTLESSGKTLRSGEETVADMNYLHGYAGIHRSDPLYFEKRMLDDWFRARFVEGRSG